MPLDQLFVIESHSALDHGNILPRDWRSDRRAGGEWSALLHDFGDRFPIDLFAPAHYQAACINQTVGYYRAPLALRMADTCDHRRIEPAEWGAVFAGGPF